MDYERKMWLKSLDLGIYSSRDHINLHAPSKFAKNNQHPLLEHYNINAFPFIVLLDKNGRIYAKIEVGLSTEELSSLIDKALNEEDESVKR